MSITVKKKAQFTTGKAGKQVFRKKVRPTESQKPAPERIPRISRLMALAIHFDGLIRKGIVRDYADLARLGGITRARMTQIMNLLNLAPEIQEKLLFLPGTASGRDAVTEREMRRVCDAPLWKKQQDGANMRLNRSSYTD
ncbi:MAG: hypothetical protein ACFUZC_10885 [Chthoniobacteraceae bacterium]